MPLESIPPFAIIVGAITAIGGIQYAAHVLPMGKPKAVGLDKFDNLLIRRDDRIKKGKGVQK
jgi:NADH dehydrogenase (ubiquinone) 1 alpha subcomplex subunit 1